MVVELLSNRPERTAAGAVWHLAEASPRSGDGARRGEADNRTLPEGWRPVTVASARRLPGPAAAIASRWLVRFAEVDSREAAEGLRGATAWAAPLDDHDALWVHELVGSEVVDATGRQLGPVVAVVANPASDLLELASGGLVPLRFVTGHQPGRIDVDIPPGLVE